MRKRRRATRREKKIKMEFRQTAVVTLVRCKNLILNAEKIVPCLCEVFSKTVNQ